MVLNSLAEESSKEKKRTYILFRGNPFFYLLLYAKWLQERSLDSLLKVSLKIALLTISIIWYLAVMCYPILSTIKLRKDNEQNQLTE